MTESEFNSQTQSVYMIAHEAFKMWLVVMMELLVLFVLIASLFWPWRNRLRVEGGLQDGWELRCSHPGGPIFFSHRLPSGAVVGGKWYWKHREVQWLAFFFLHCFGWNLNCSPLVLSTHEWTIQTENIYLLNHCLSDFTEICERWETYSANSGTQCHCHWKTKVRYVGLRWNP